MHPLKGGGGRRKKKRKKKEKEKKKRKRTWMCGCAGWQELISYVLL